MSLIIQNINQLSDALHGVLSGLFTYEEVMQSVNFSIEDVQEYVFWNPEKYARNCIERKDEHELILMCWEKGQKTAIHNHGGQEGWISIVQGEVSEEVYSEKDGDLEFKERHVLHPGQCGGINDTIGWHRLANTADGRSISLHLYVNPIPSLDFFDEEENKIKSADLQYYTEGGRMIKNE